MKQIVKLQETDLAKIVTESVNNIINEGYMCLPGFRQSSNSLLSELYDYKNIIRHMTNCPINNKEMVLNEIEKLSTMVSKLLKMYNMQNPIQRDEDGDEIDDDDDIVI